MGGDHRRKLITTVLTIILNKPDFKFKAVLRVPGTRRFSPENSGVGDKLDPLIASIPSPVTN